MWEKATLALRLMLALYLRLYALYIHGIPSELIGFALCVHGRPRPPSCELGCDHWFIMPSLALIYVISSSSC